MGLYERMVLPRVVHLACSSRPNMKQREKVVPRARGTVLEIGIGSGLNLAFYDSAQVTKVWGLDPSPQMIQMAAAAARRTPLEVEFIEAGCEQIPVDSNSIDTVVITYTLCTIADSESALREMARVLKPGGRLLFCEHGAAPDANVLRWQRRLNPVWRRLGGGCHLDRDTPELLRRGGFEITEMETMYIPGWRPASFNYWGSAESRQPGEARGTGRGRARDAFGKRLRSARAFNGQEKNRSERKATARGSRRGCWARALIDCSPSFQEDP